MKKVRVLLLGALLMSMVASFGNAATTYMFTSLTDSGALKGGVGYNLTDMICLELSANKNGSAQTNFYADAYYGPYAIGVGNDGADYYYDIMYSVSKPINSELSLCITATLIEMYSKENTKPNYLPGFSASVSVPLF
ncbi:MAG: hypothetical protein DKM50_09560 [Candidatus Margulisiibacteriota bacterium]|nr:MAG: hypothetical protein A2X43_05015 [Candidatus Margulisbacteria bacterium GWD2_39_127]OGI02370.1 MAG: hypothetical protein A2X42_09455 [Candidatus Margulisbacteria bacterium GWF2_38_17]OGI08503.1 MAG: hypothetical protein A2X41_07245 [Candidatus Margulisbacteria bacterium GWE2_39_32]PZM79015.1 MAG: hypothetical protein DKM50_09560 [Candidatus Margulisiibacteriota bacterium]HAR64206.1 hypothetical protein [Candidatus Margulisiibacteriota bacterium]